MRLSLVLCSTRACAPAPVPIWHQNSNICITNIIFRLVFNSQLNISYESWRTVIHQHIGQYVLCRSVNITGVKHLLYFRLKRYIASWQHLTSAHCMLLYLRDIDYTVYPKKYAHGFCFAVLWCGYTLTDFPISIRLTSLALWQSNDCPSASKATLMNIDKYFMWIH